MADWPPDILEYFKTQGQRGGKKAAKSLTAAERSERAKKAAAKSAEVRTKNAASKKKAVKKRAPPGATKKKA